MLPVQPEPAKTRLTSSAVTPKSSSTSTGSPRARASSDAVDDTVTSPRAPVRASLIGPLANAKASAATAPCSTSPAQRTS